MRRYRFIVFDEHKLIAESREFPAIDDETAIRVADGWRDIRGGQVWRESNLIKHWRHGSMKHSDDARTVVRVRGRV